MTLVKKTLKTTLEVRNKENQHSLLRHTHAEVLHTFIGHNDRVKMRKIVDDALMFRLKSL